MRHEDEVVAKAATHRGAMMKQANKAVWRMFGRYRRHNDRYGLVRGCSSDRGSLPVDLADRDHSGRHEIALTITHSLK